LMVLRNNDGAKDNSLVEALEREGKRGYNPPHRQPPGAGDP
jgi:hypothetical protein